MVIQHSIAQPQKKITGHQRTVVLPWWHRLLQPQDESFSELGTYVQKVRSRFLIVIISREKLLNIWIAEQNFCWPDGLILPLKFNIQTIGGQSMNDSATN